MTNKIEPVAYQHNLKGVNGGADRFELSYSPNACGFPPTVTEFVGGSVLPLYALPEGSKILSAEDVGQVREALRKSHTLIENNGMDGDFILAAIQILEE